MLDFTAEHTVFKSLPATPLDDISLPFKYIYHCPYFPDTVRGDIASTVNKNKKAILTHWNKHHAHFFIDGDSLKVLNENQAFKNFDALKNFIKTHLLKKVNDDVQKEILVNHCLYHFHQNGLIHAGLAALTRHYHLQNGNRVLPFFSPAVYFFTAENHIGIKEVNRLIGLWDVTSDKINRFNKDENYHAAFFARLSLTDDKPTASLLKTAYHLPNASLLQQIVNTISATTDGLKYWLSSSNNKKCPAPFNPAQENLQQDIQQALGELPHFHRLQPLADKTFKQCCKLYIKNHTFYKKLEEKQPALTTRLKTADNNIAKLIKRIETLSGENFIEQQNHQLEEETKKIKGYQARLQKYIDEITKKQIALNDKFDHLKPSEQINLRTEKTNIDEKYQRTLTSLKEEKASVNVFLKNELQTSIITQKRLEYIAKLAETKSKLLALKENMLDQQSQLQSYLGKLAIDTLKEMLCKRQALYFLANSRDMLLTEIECALKQYKEKLNSNEAVKSKARNCLHAFNQLQTQLNEDTKALKKSVTEDTQKDILKKEAIAELCTSIDETTKQYKLQINDINQYAKQHPFSLPSLKIKRLSTLDFTDTENLAIRIINKKNKTRCKTIQDIGLDALKKRMARYQRTVLFAIDGKKKTVALIENYCSPPGGWFLSLHWRRHNANIQRGKNLLDSIRDIDETEVLEKINGEIYHCTFDETINKKGSYFKRLLQTKKWLDDSTEDKFQYAYSKVTI